MVKRPVQRLLGCFDYRRSGLFREIGIYETFGRVEIVLTRLVHNTYLAVLGRIGIHSCFVNLSLFKRSGILRVADTNDKFC